MQIYLLFAGQKALQLNPAALPTDRPRYCQDELLPIRNPSTELSASAVAQSVARHL